MHFRSILVFAAALSIGAVTHAGENLPGALQIVKSFARPTVAGQTTAASYLTIENKGKQSDKLIGVSSPVAKESMLHSMTMDGETMKMREVENIEILPAAKIEMKPGHGYHIMLLGLRRQLKSGENIPMTLRFEHAGSLKISVPVK